MGTDEVRSEPPAKPKFRRLNDQERLEILLALPGPKYTGIHSIARQYGVKVPAVRQLLAQREEVLPRLLATPEKVRRATFRRKAPPKPPKPPPAPEYPERPRRNGLRMTDQERLEILMALDTPAPPSMRALARKYNVDETAVRQLVRKGDQYLRMLLATPEDVRRTRRVVYNRFANNPFEGPPRSHASDGGSSESKRTHLEDNLRLTDQDRLDILLAFGGPTPPSVPVAARHFGVQPATIKRVLKEREKALPILLATDEDTRRAARGSKGVACNAIDRGLMAFIADLKEQDLKYTLDDLRAEAIDIATSLGIENFKASESWLKAFRQRQGIPIITHRKPATEGPICFEL
ncbi:hypothetical protein SPRG_01497 [Saprolegnia parasitica CBS 223.65]|uniref:HTH CENPB-type domain-containing protein n=1 Tax=Saprolegnia parasitica (strain CBS 223.65) TaxID=695850 RepID=A0A067D6P3_SAPPC|nr:hypothetical protein SPRG_01497 [Saprolegnia parasitica CBS 223.65]KDO34361.1 hypothetical protein SPRG_01497 [Saprolegnia parasitica CBS 223.65]|eukprot:XP_012195097.1 hypothetical protein SPRG_01497 [Saprolegnia parasitica CBS 223.65]